MFKFTFLCVILAISYIYYSQAIDVNKDSNSTSVLVGSLVDVHESNITVRPQLFTITSTNQSPVITSTNPSVIRNLTSDTHEDNNDVKGYYDWLDFIKSSTPDTTQNNTKA
ncbi:hypothetical protein I4U23_028984 [Adineta vaga]|nr:hypothetical protein I4U23_028984 [Adineta vaga]